MVVCDWEQVRIYTGEEYRQFYWVPVPPTLYSGGRVATLDEKGNLWIADDASGLVHIDTKTKLYDFITADGPANSSAYALCFTNGILAMVPGSRNTSTSPGWTVGTISALEAEQWSYSNFDFNKFPKSTGFNSVAINPLNTNEIFMASWNGGLYKINKSTDEKMWYNHNNSSLDSLRKDSVIFLSGLAVDKQNNLWMAQSDAVDLLKVKELNTKEEKWHSINIGMGGILAEHILVDSRNYKWVTLAKNGLVAFSENGSLTNNGVHRWRKIELNSQAIVQTDRITCIAEDREGRIWIGANQGVKVIYDAASVFNRDVFAKNILLEQVIGDTSYVQPLLENDYINCITVDAADRKWIGTQNSGVFFLSPSGTQQLFNFTTENSPLFSNQILDIKINPENGEVFIATAEGLLSYKGTATVARENYKEVLVYPNPVREDYFGPIAVKGLMEDSFCKITDSAGNLVWQGYAYGGQLIWNGKDLNGRRPATGVYFVMASSKTGKERKVAKFLFVQ